MLPTDQAVTVLAVRLDLEKNVHSLSVHLLWGGDSVCRGDRWDEEYKLRSGH